jgi:acetylornithine/succinyldiaminopimelate/putrescine aminotransferase
MLGLPVREPYAASAFVPAALERGLLINAAGRNTLRFVPPLIITADETRDAIVRLRAAIADVTEGGSRVHPHTNEAAGGAFAD